MPRPPKPPLLPLPSTPAPFGGGACVLKCQLQRPRLSQLLAFWSQYHSKPRSRGRNYSHYTTEGGLRDLAALERGVSLPGSEKILGNLSLTQTWPNDTNTGVGKSGTVESNNRKPSRQEYGHQGVPGAFQLPPPTRAHTGCSGWLQHQTAHVWRLRVWAREACLESRNRAQNRSSHPPQAPTPHSVPGVPFNAAT